MVWQHFIELISCHYSFDKSLYRIRSPLFMIEFGRSLGFVDVGMMFVLLQMTTQEKLGL